MRHCSRLRLSRAQCSQRPVLIKREGRQNINATSRVSMGCSVSSRPGPAGARGLLGLWPVAPRRCPCFPGRPPRHCGGSGPGAFRRRCAWWPRAGGLGSQGTGAIKSQEGTRKWSLGEKSGWEISVAHGIQGHPEKNIGKIGTMSGFQQWNVGRPPQLKSGCSEHMGGRGGGARGLAHASPRLPAVVERGPAASRSPPPRKISTSGGE